MFFLVLILFFTDKAFAQQTIFNVPSADVTEKGVLFLQHESQFSNKFGLFTHYGAYGVGKNTELDLTLIGVGTKGVRNEILGIGFKSFIPLHKKTNTKLTFGHLIPVSLRGDGVGSYSYSHISTIIPKLGTRISSGVLAGSTLILGRDTVCFIGGIEHPVTKKFNLLAEWHSGKHGNGLFIGGFSYYFPKDTNLYVGYQVPNSEKVTDKGFVIEISKLLR